ncbi:DUF429 domain-containing protein [Nitrosomonadales bacterium]|nr:DUF429 domain-containing protein [Nitrosomonadales bacterium]
MSGVIGIDGCRAGWIITKILDDQSLSFHIIENLDDNYLKKGNISHIGIDIPLILSETGKRFAETEARTILKKRSCTIFSPPTFSALKANNYIEASEINFRQSGKRLSKQSWNLFPKIKQAQKFLKYNNKINLFEIHPELSFMAMNDMNLVLESKKTIIGKKIRIKLIKRFFPSFSFELVRKKYNKNEVLDDDILDSISVVWSTQRIVDNIAQFVPKKPEKNNMKIYF